jgi:hypothetical protein
MVDRDGFRTPMGATHFLMKTLPKFASEMALSVLAYDLTRVMNIIGTRALLVSSPLKVGDREK